MNTVQRAIRGMTVVMVLTGTFSATPVFSQAVDGWSYSAGSGDFTKMTIGHPKTYLANEESITIQVNGQDYAQGGSVKFFGGVDRELTPGEAAYYFEALGGLHAFWSMLGSQGRLTTVDVKSGPVASQYYGKITRIETAAGRELIGKLERLTDDSNGFSLVVDGACCGAIRFERGAVSMMQQIK
jgi:hypothetical protein